MELQVSRLEWDKILPEPFCLAPTRQPGLFILFPDVRRFLGILGRLTDQDREAKLQAAEERLEVPPGSPWHLVLCFSSLAAHRRIT